VKLRISRTYCFNAGFSEVPSGLTPQPGSAASGAVHNPGKSGGTGTFVKAGVQVIGHVNEKEGLKTYTNAAGTPEAPNVTFDKDYSIKLGNREVAHVYYFGKASTNGDAFVYFPDLKVITMGDVFQRGMNCDYAQGGSMSE
jgi:cyclase